MTRTPATGKNRIPSAAGSSIDLAVVKQVLSRAELLVTVRQTELRARVIEQAGVRDTFTRIAELAVSGDHSHTDSDGDTSGGGAHSHSAHLHRLGIDFKPGDNVIVGYLGGRTNAPVVLGRLVGAASEEETAATPVGGTGSALVTKKIPARPGLVDGPLTNPTLIVIHSTEGGQSQQSTENAAVNATLASADGSAHYFVGPAGVTQSVDEGSMARGAAGVNKFAIHVEHGGRVTDSWTSPDAVAIIAMSAKLLADISRRRGILLRELSARQLFEGEVNGVATHAVVNEFNRLAGRKNTGHTDPGPNFPLDDLLRLAKSA